MKHYLIVSLSRSGGKLMRTLLDGHPQLNTFSFEHWNRSSKTTFPARKIAVFGGMTPDEKLATAGVSLVQKKLRRRHPEALVAEVLNAWRRDAAHVPVLPGMYESLARRYFAALGRNPEFPVVNHCGSVCRLTRVQVDAVFGKGVHLLTVRDPRAVFTSMEALRHQKYTVKRIRKHKIPASAIARHVEQMEVSHGASSYLRQFCDDYRMMVAEYAMHPDVVCVRFEDLVTSPEATMRRVCERIELSWEPTLVEPTAFGEVRQPNSSYRREGGRVHASASGDWVTRIAPATRVFIESALASEMQALGYNPIQDREAAASVAHRSRSQDVGAP